MKQLQVALEELFTNVMAFEESRRWEVQQRWRKAFAPQVKSWAGPLRDCCWHALSYDLSSSLRGADAVYEFEHRVGPDLVLLATEEPSLTPTYRVAAKGELTYRELAAAWPRDLYLIAEDWSWSFVMTHEQGWLGPYLLVAADSDGDA